MTPTPIRIGLIGAGYISDWHAEAIAAVPGIALSAVCDRSDAAAEAFGRSHGVPHFTDLSEMIAAQACDAVHVLTPPDTHAPIAMTCLRAGLDCLLEKPAALSARELEQVQECADACGRRLAIGHNFLALPSYRRMRAALRSGDLGRVAQADINWHFPLAPLRSGPFGLWMLRAPGNLLLELGPHLFAYAVDLFGPLQILHVETSKPIALPGGQTCPQGWRILARAGQVDVTLTLSLVETFDDRSVTVRGSSGLARLDFAAGCLVIDRENTADIIFNPLLRQLRLARQTGWNALRNATVQLSSLNRKTPYGLSFRAMLSEVYAAQQEGSPVPDRFGRDARAVMQAIDACRARLPQSAAPAIRPARKADLPADTVVIGGTGFIGRALTRALAARGHTVRVLSRGAANPFADLPEQVEITPCRLTDPDSLAHALAGASTVFHLGKSMDDTWEAALKNDVAVTVAVARAAVHAGVARFVYTGTIASYDMSTPGARITERTGFASDMRDRNVYARSKARCEAELMALHRDHGLPLVIARPGIVIGKGGPLQHWGIGRWHGAGAVRVWGAGHNILPFVLIDDVVTGLIAMAEHPQAIGDSFNLVGEPFLSARQYFDAIHAQLGARLRVSGSNPTLLFAVGAVKYALKRHALGNRAVAWQSLADWKGRAHLARFDNSHAKQALGWQPEADRAAFIRRGITEADLFGF